MSDGRAVAARQLVQSAFEQVRLRYGTRQAAPEVGRWLNYHNAHHTADVHRFAFAQAGALASAGVLPVEDIALAGVAAAFHDIEQDAGAGENERLSAEAAINAMQDEQYRGFFTESDAEKVRAMILATRVTFDASGLRQSVDTTSEYATLQAIVADADLGSLSTRSGNLQGLLLFIEVESGEGTFAAPRSTADIAQLVAPPESLAGFLRFQQRLFAGHEYHLERTPGQRAQQQANADLASSMADRAAQGASVALLLDEARDYSDWSPLPGALDAVPAISSVA